MGIFANLKAALSAARYLASSIRQVDGIGRGSKPRPFNYELAIREFHSWAYAASMLNAYAFASTPKRLFARNRSGVRKAYETRPIGTDLKRFFEGRGITRPSESVRRKYVEFGGDIVEVTEPHPALEVLRISNPFFNGFEMDVLRSLDLQMTGNAYLHLVVGSVGVPVEMWRMPSQWTEIMPSRESYIGGYRYGREPDVKTFAVDEVIHFKLPNPADLFYGKGWFEAAWRSLGLHDSKREVDLSKFDNYARPDWLFSVAGGKPEAIKEFEKAMTEKFRSSNGRADQRFVTVSGETKATPLQWDVVEVGSPTRVIEEISAVSGVPVAMLLSNDPTRASSETARLGWYRNTIQPMCRLDEEKLNEQWIPRFDGSEDLFIAHDPANFEDQTAQSRRVAELVKGGVLTPNDGRAELGYAPHKQGDDLYAPIGATGGGSVSGESTESDEGSNNGRNQNDR